MARKTGVEQVNEITTNVNASNNILNGLKDYLTGLESQIPIVQFSKETVTPERVAFGQKFYNTSGQLSSGTGCRLRLVTAFTHQQTVPAGPAQSFPTITFSIPNSTAPEAKMVIVSFVGEDNLSVIRVVKNIFGQPENKEVIATVSAEDVNEDFDSNGKGMMVTIAAFFAKKTWTEQYSVELDEVGGGDFRTDIFVLGDNLRNK